MIPEPLHRFMHQLATPLEFRDWLYRDPDPAESVLDRDTFLALLELDYADDRAAADMRGRLVELLPPLAPAGVEEDLDAALVEADALQGRGDPRGELVTLQAGLQDSGAGCSTPRRPIS